MMKKVWILVLFLCKAFLMFGQTGEIRGKIIEKGTGEALPGANIIVDGSTQGTVSDLDGNYTLKILPGTYRIKISFISFKTVELPDVTVSGNKVTEVNAALEEASTGIEEVVVTSVRKMNSEISMLSAMKSSSVVMNGVSSQQISKTQDRNASEVIKRISGISIIDEKFIIARGLSQRYNNVWINNSAVPSSESDTRSFSFDMIPGSQIENIMIVKSPAPELPADFSGGFVKLATKSMPSENQVQVSYGVNFNTRSQFHDFEYSNGSSTDFLGFNSGKRDLRAVAGNSQMDARMDNNNASQVTGITKSGFNNDWSVKTKRPIPDQRFSIMLNRHTGSGNGYKWGLVAALNYSYSSRLHDQMKNARYGIYNGRDDEPDYKYSYTDNQNTTDARIGGMFNVTFLMSDRNRIEFRNIINQLGRDRYTTRDGYEYHSAKYQQIQQEYIYASRLGYSGQFAGIHTISGADKLDWTIGYSYANKNQPDRRVIRLSEDSDPGDHFGQMRVDQNEIERDYIRLGENITSAAVNFSHIFRPGTGFMPSIKAGAYAEYRDRKYDTRLFTYRWIESNMPGDFPYRDVISQVLVPENYDADKLFIYEDSDYRNNYKVNSLLYAGYLGFNIPLKSLNLYAGLRVESNSIKLTSYTSISNSDMTRKYEYPQTDVFPSVNASYNFNKSNLLRFAYGASVNRQEFRELSPSVYYDFDLFSDIKGNPDLKPAYIQNFDLRYEFYPTSGELVSLAFFYKNFSNPIEWTFLDAGGGSYTYTFENARIANNYGIEIDIKKELGFIGMPDFSLSVNSSFISSKVQFEEGSQEHDRPMQGQSPYIVNAGIFYQDPKDYWMIGILYNVIGKRIVSIGKNDSHSGEDINNDIPDMYEMPRNVLDLTIRRKLGKKMEISASVRDLLAQTIVFKQFPKYYDQSGNLQEREQTTKEYKPGQNISVSVKMNF